MDEAGVRSYITTYRVPCSDSVCLYLYIPANSSWAEIIGCLHSGGPIDFVLNKRLRSDFRLLALIEVCAKDGARELCHKITIFGVLTADCMSLRG